MRFCRFSIKKSDSDQAGFTLLEMLVYLAILVIIIGVIIAFCISAIRAVSKIKANAEILDNSRRAIEIMSYEIKKAKSLYTPASVFDVNPGQLSLEQSASPAAEESETFVDFFLCGDRLCLKREGESALAITSDKVKLTNLIFRQLLNSVPSVQISFRVEFLTASALPAYSGSIDITTTVSLRGR